MGPQHDTEESPPVVVSSNRYLDIEPYCRALYRSADKHIWTGVMPWEFPQYASREDEEAFLLRYFTVDEVNIQGGAAPPGDGFRFLKQVWYCCALWNWEQRIPALAKWWMEDAENRSTLTDPDMTDWLLSADVVPTTFFTDTDVGMYGDKCICATIGYIQSLIADYRVRQGHNGTSTAASVEQKMTNSTELAGSVPSIAEDSKRDNPEEPNLDVGKKPSVQQNDLPSMQHVPDKNDAQRGERKFAHNASITTRGEHMQNRRNWQSNEYSMSKIRRFNQEMQQPKATPAQYTIPTQDSNGSLGTRRNFQGPRTWTDSGVDTSLGSVSTTPNISQSSSAPPDNSPCADLQPRYPNSAKRPFHNRNFDNSRDARNHERREQAYGGQHMRGGNTRGLHRSSRGRSETSYNNRTLFETDWINKQESNLALAAVGYDNYYGRGGRTPSQQRPREGSQHYSVTPDRQSDHATPTTLVLRDAGNASSQLRPSIFNQSMQGSNRHASAHDVVSHFPQNQVDRWTIGSAASHVTKLILFGVSPSISDVDVYQYFAGFSCVTGVSHDSDGLYDSRNLLIEFANHWGAIAVLARRGFSWPGGVITVEVAPMYWESAHAPYFGLNTHHSNRTPTSYYGQNVVTRGCPSPGTSIERRGGSILSAAHSRIPPTHASASTPADVVQDGSKKVKKSGSKSKRKNAHRQAHDSENHAPDRKEGMQSQGSGEDQTDMPDQSAVRTEPRPANATSKSPEIFRKENAQTAVPSRPQPIVATDAGPQPIAQEEDLNSARMALHHRVMAPHGIEHNEERDSSNRDCSDGMHEVSRFSARGDHGDETGPSVTEVPTKTELVANDRCKGSEDIAASRLARDGEKTPHSPSDRNTSSEPLAMHGRLQETKPPSPHFLKAGRPGSPRSKEPVKKPDATPVAHESATGVGPHGGFDSERDSACSNVDILPTPGEQDTTRATCLIEEQKGTKKGATLLDETFSPSHDRNENDGRVAQAAAVVIPDPEATEASVPCLSSEVPVQLCKKAKGPAQTESFSVFAKQPKASNKKTKAGKRKKVDDQRPSTAHSATVDSRVDGHRLSKNIDTADGTSSGNAQSTSNVKFGGKVTSTKPGPSQHRGATPGYGKSGVGVKPHPTQRKRSGNASEDARLTHVKISEGLGPVQATSFAKERDMSPHEAYDGRGCDSMHSVPSIAAESTRDLSCSIRTKANESYDVPVNLPQPSIATAQIASCEHHQELLSDEDSSTTLSGDEVQFTPPSRSPSRPAPSLGSRIRALQRRAQQNNLVVSSPVRRKKAKKRGRKNTSQQAKQNQSSDNGAFPERFQGTNIIFYKSDSSTDAEDYGASDDADAESDIDQDPEIEKHVSTLTRLGSLCLEEG